MGDELVMTTEPRHRDLIAASEGDEWAALPDDTTMGHVHLHAGDLERAEAFYHNALGFDKKVWSYPGALFLSAGNSPIRRESMRMRLMLSSFGVPEARSAPDVYPNRPTCTSNRSAMPRRAMDAVRRYTCELEVSPAWS